MLRNRLAPLVMLLGALHLPVALGCYYSALNLENPADYYYRYCNVGCHGMDSNQAVFNACCTPLALSATTPPACSTAMASMSGQVSCKWGDVPTSDFPTSSYSYQPPVPTTSTPPPPVTSSSLPPGPTSEPPKSSEEEHSSEDCSTSSGVEGQSTSRPPTSTDTATLPNPPSPPSTSPTPPKSSDSPPPPPPPKSSDSPAPPPPVSTNTPPVTSSTTHPPPPPPTTSKTTGHDEGENCWCGKENGAVTTCQDKSGGHYTKH